jgi:hypothetical protein
MKKNTNTCTRLGLDVGRSSTAVLVLLCSLLGNSKAFQGPTLQSLRQQQGQLAASYSAFEDMNNVHNSRDNDRDSNSNRRKEFSFAEKRSIESRLDRLEQTAAATLQGFYEPHLLSFSIKPGSVKVSTNTVQCTQKCTIRLYCVQPASKM